LRTRRLYSRKVCFFCCRCCHGPRSGAPWRRRECPSAIGGRLAHPGPAQVRRLHQHPFFCFLCVILSFLLAVLLVRLVRSSLSVLVLLHFVTYFCFSCLLLLLSPFFLIVYFLFDPLQFDFFHFFSFATAPCQAWGKRCIFAPVRGALGPGGRREVRQRYKPPLFHSSGWSVDEKKYLIVSMMFWMDY
jgi:hypothetical protein